MAIYKNNGPIYLTQAQYDALSNKVVGQEYRIIDEAWIESTAIAETYDSSKTYAVDDVVEYNGYIYVCNTAITTAEAWDSTKWSKLGALAKLIVDSAKKLSYVHKQLSASDEWTVNHNLGYYPNVTVIDSAGTVCLGDIIYNDANTLTIKFSAAFGGIAYCS